MCVERNRGGRVECKFFLFEQKTRKIKMKKKSISFLCLSLFSHFLYSRRELDLEHVFHVWSEGLEADGVQRDVVFLFCFPVFVWGEGKNKRRSNTMLTTRKLTRKQRERFYLQCPLQDGQFPLGGFLFSSLRVSNHSSHQVLRAFTSCRRCFYSSSPSRLGRK